MTKYREPTNDDIGKIVEVTDSFDDFVGSLERKLIYVLPDLYLTRFICERGNNSSIACRWEYARIKIEESEFVSTMPEINPEKFIVGPFIEYIQSLEKRIWELENKD